MIQFKVQAIPFEINLREERCLLIYIDKTKTALPANIIITWLWMILMWNQIFLCWIIFWRGNNVINLVKKIHALRAEGRVLTLRSISASFPRGGKCFFKNTSSYETRYSNHHNTGYTMFKPVFNYTESNFWIRYLKRFLLKISKRNSVNLWSIVVFQLWNLSTCLQLRLKNNPC